MKKTAMNMGKTRWSIAMSVQRIQYDPILVGSIEPTGENIWFFFVAQVTTMESQGEYRIRDAIYLTLLHVFFLRGPVCFVLLLSDCRPMACHKVAESGVRLSHVECFCLGIFS